ncbi:MAG: hypothetical protein DHS20C17_21360 [Cyclobacteriaceae bacterium]|nr:MAG: hypothetical protein DHS20C17_21360 [Cyclobacteriaceae bacterium]
MVSRVIKSILFLLACFGMPRAYAQDSGGNQIEVVNVINHSKVDIKVDGELFTSFVYSEDLKKPVLWPVISPAGNMLTRSYPFIDKAGDRVDHPHQVGVWFNYGNVNGLDFWNNSSTIPEDKKHEYGVIVHQTLEKVQSGSGRAMLAASANWETRDYITLLEEHTSFEFEVNDPIRIIDRISTLKATSEVTFKDNKEGLFAIRVAGELELPSDESIKQLDSTGAIINAVRSDSKLAGGGYRSALGLEGAGVWGSRCRWMKLSGEISGELVSVVIIDHPGNPGYPTYWHARGYGLFAANNLGQRIFSQGNNELNFKLKTGESAVFKYRLVIAGQDLTDDQINLLADQFAEK